MNKIHLHQKEILEKFEKRIESHACHSCWSDDYNCTCEPEKASMRGLLIDIKEALHSQVEVIKGMIEKKSDIRVAKADGSAEENFDYGYDVKTNEVLDLLTIHEDKTP